MQVEESKLVEDRLLMTGIAAGDAAALERLYEKYSAELMNVAMRILRNRHDAEDVILDVFWELWRRANRFDAARGRPWAYLLLLVRSRCKDLLKTRFGRRSKHTPCVSALDPEFRCKFPDPVETAAHSERLGKVHDLLSSMDKNRRQPLSLFLLEGFTHSEIADLTGQPLGTVKTRIRLGLIDLRQILA